ncbi:MAG: amidohydrolase/deacetylase family metallohydrolase [Candidatus Latescibacteria bacterium]|nr:amidohydrolase/deacetylase family metallohydrolase [Candidatus Latescibacterota bacterium]
MLYDMVLKNATVIDPAQQIHRICDVAVTGERIAAVGTDLAGRQSEDLRGMILTPGWIDIHAHIYAGATTWGIQADALCLATGVTTIVDAGSPGWANFLAFREFIAQPARTQILTFVHICGIGLTYGPVGELHDMRFADAERTAFAIDQWPDTCVGVKVRQGRSQVGDNGVEPLRLAVLAGTWSQTPVMVHIGAGVPLPEVLELMRPADIATHCYQGVGDAIVDAEGQVIPAVWEARQRGVLFDVGHGGGSFRFDVAKQALGQGFPADVISTDWHVHSLGDPVESLPETASKLLHLGVELPEVVRQTTAAAAAAIGQGGELGTLAVGTVADLAAFAVRQGQFNFRDVSGQLEVGRQKIEPVLTVRAGRVYRPDELAEEVAEARRRAQFMSTFTRGDLAALGWEPHR